MNADSFAVRLVRRAVGLPEEAAARARPVPGDDFDRVEESTNTGAPSSQGPAGSGRVAPRTHRADPASGDLAPTAHLMKNESLSHGGSKRQPPGGDPPRLEDASLAAETSPAAGVVFPTHPDRPAPLLGTDCPAETGLRRVSGAILKEEPPAPRPPAAWLPPPSPPACVPAAAQPLPARGPMGVVEQALSTEIPTPLPALHAPESGPAFAPRLMPEPIASSASRSTPAAPRIQVKIGRVEVYAEAPARAERAPSARQAPDFVAQRAARRYLDRRWY
jgi:hypothetical protein